MSNFLDVSELLGDDITPNQPCVPLIPMDASFAACQPAIDLNNRAADLRSKVCASLDSRLRAPSLVPGGVVLLLSVRLPCGSSLVWGTVAHSFVRPAPAAWSRRSPPATRAHGATVSITAVFRLPQGELQEARSMSEQSVEIFIRTVGPQHPNTLIAQKNLAAISAQS